MTRKCAIFSLALALNGGCGLEVPTSRPSVELMEESGEPLTGVPAVPRFVLRSTSEIRAENIWLVRGDVSSVSQAKLEKGEVPEVVADQRQPLAVWGEAGALILAPSTVLEPGQGYSFILVGGGLLGSFSVSEEVRPVLSLWTDERVAPGADVVYCLGQPPVARLPSAGTRLEGNEDDAVGLGEPRTGQDVCVQFGVPEAEGFFVPPASVGQYFVEPRPVVVDESTPSRSVTSPQECEESFEHYFSGGCLRGEEGSLRLLVGAGSYYLRLHAKNDAESGIGLLVQTGGEASHSLGPLEPETEYFLEIVRFGSTGVGALEQVEFESGPPAPRFVLTEVLADPLGPEPEAEWVEVTNIGSQAASLGGLELWDSGGGVALPDVELEPGAVGVIVRHDFSPGPDVVPLASAVPVLVDRLGENGLRNSGEEVSLRDATGRRLSTVLSLGASEGKSVSRRHPWDPDLVQSFEVTDTPTPGEVSALESAVP